MNTEQKQPLSERVRRWTFEAALPFWADHGLDRRHGGYVELFDADGRASAPFKRTRVTARQIYVFSHAALLGWPGGAAAAEHGYRYLLERTRLPDGGWAKRLSPEGEVSDPTPDLYDYAFVLFALAWYARASGEAEPLQLAHATLDQLEARFRQPSGGFAHVLPMEARRLQNPHMHLLEAALAWMATAPDEPRFRALADELALLFRTRFFDGRSLAEVFDPDWRRTPNDDGRERAGHQFEWAWILAQHQRLTSADNTALSQALFDFAEAHGVHPATQQVFNAVREDGTATDRSSRTWTNTERIKGAVALCELTGRDTRAAVTGSAQLLFDRYLDDRGSWIDLLDEQGRPVAGDAPASTFYHLFLAFAELLRVSRKLAL